VSGGGDPSHKLTLNLEAAKSVSSLPLPAIAAGEQPSPSVAIGIAAQRPGQKLKAFLRPSQKRARASPPAALQVQVPATPVAAHDGGVEHPLTPVQGRRPEEREREEGSMLAIPSFLNQSRQGVQKLLSPRPRYSEFGADLRSQKSMPNSKKLYGSNAADKWSRSPTPNPNSAGRDYRPQLPEG
jgi:hypothetical protein